MQSTKEKEIDDDSLFLDKHEREAFQHFTSDHSLPAKPQSKIDGGENIFDCISEKQMSRKDPSDSSGPEDVKQKDGLKGHKPLFILEEPRLTHLTAPEDYQTEDILSSQLSDDSKPGNLSKRIV